MSRFQPVGTGVALVTPFREGRIDFDALTRLIEHVIDGGVEYLVSLGTTGEATSLSDAEQEQVIRHTVKTAAGRVPVVAGHFGGNQTDVLCQKLRAFDPDGISAILSSSPAYVKPTQDGIYRHYMALAEASPLPIIIYNVPSRTASNISAATLVKLARASETFIGVKDASGDMVQGAAIVRDAPEDFAVLSGDDPTALPLIALGGKGVISVLANAMPRPFTDMIRAGLDGRWEEARALHFKLLDIHPWLYVEGNPGGIKEALAHLGLIDPELRLPLARMSEGNRQKLVEVMEAAMR
ncbi:MAG: 4-hydroxy-tetrahydrodipicolinate synthase [Bryobacter sp.]|jgi:4-hydroxy-tetrahydrodipicolinate synthase|nr:4-hydroxy-tetrahydrodipicolinate synthase [Bryobacter sp.]